MQGCEIAGSDRDSREHARERILGIAGSAPSGVRWGVSYALLPKAAARLTRLTRGRALYVHCLLHRPEQKGVVATAPHSCGHLRLPAWADHSSPPASISCGAEAHGCSEAACAQGASETQRVAQPASQSLLSFETPSRHEGFHATRTEIACRAARTDCGEFAIVRLQTASARKVGALETIELESYPGNVNMHVEVDSSGMRSEYAVVGCGLSTVCGLCLT